MRRNPRIAAFTLVEVLVVIGIVAVLMAILIPVIVKARAAGKRTQCMNNVRQIGQALLGYAVDNKGELPRIRFEKDRPPGHRPPEVPPDAPNPFATTYYNDSPSALFLLVRTGRIGPAPFVCPATDDVVDDLGGQPANERANFSKNVADLEGVRTRSYTYARLYPTVEAIESGFVTKVQQMKADYALLADYGLPSCALPSDPAQWTDKKTKGNSLNHGQAGQNVLYLDGRVEWQMTNRCGAVQPEDPTATPDPTYIPRDNIYKGHPGSACSPDRPKNAADSVLEENI